MKPTIIFSAVLICISAVAVSISWGQLPTPAATASGAATPTAATAPIATPTNSGNGQSTTTVTTTRPDKNKGGKINGIDPYVGYVSMYADSVDTGTTVTTTPDNYVPNPLPAHRSAADSLAQQEAVAMTVPSALIAGPPPMPQSASVSNSSAQDTTVPQGGSGVGSGVSNGGSSGN